MTTPSGRELDALIERVVFGNEVREIESPWDGKDWSNTNKEKWDDCIRTVATISGFATVGGHVRVAHYSTEISAAWEVVEKMRQVGFVVFEIGIDGGSDWTVSFGKTWPPENGMGLANTASLAICEAALEAIGYEAE